MSLHVLFCLTKLFYVCPIFFEFILHNLAQCHFWYIFFNRSSSKLTGAGLQNNPSFNEGPIFFGVLIKILKMNHEDYSKFSLFISSCIFAKIML